MSSARWQIALWVCLLGWAIFKSVDPSLAYIFIGGAAFGLFKILQARKSGYKSSRSQHEAHSYRKPDSVAEPIFKEVWNKKFSSQPTQSQKRSKAVVIAASVFVAFTFFIILVGVFLGSESSVDYNFFQQRASEFYNSQQYDSSAYYYRLALQDEPENADLWFERGNAFLNLPNIDSAIIMYRKALLLNPQHEQAQYNLGYIYYERKNYKDAIEETKKILGYNTDYTDAKLLIGDSFYNQNRLDSALFYYESAYQTGYRSAILSHLMAYIYDTKGNFSEAIKFYREAIGQDSSIVEIYVRLSELVPGQEGTWFRNKAATLQVNENR